MLTECFFRFVYEERTLNYCIYFELKNKQPNLKLFFVDFKVEYEDGNILNLDKRVFDMSRQCYAVWSFHSFLCNVLETITFRLYFDSTVEPLLKNSKETGEQFCYTFL